MPEDHRERFAEAQEKELEEIRCLVPSEPNQVERFMLMAMDTYDALVRTRPGRVFAFRVHPDSASNPCQQRFLHADVPQKLLGRWEAWARDYTSFAARNPKLELFDLMSAISEDQTSSSWPYGQEEDLRRWAAARTSCPSPLEQRGLDHEVVHRRLSELNDVVCGWLYWKDDLRKVVFEEDYLGGDEEAEVPRAGGS